jgi:hypothetical protein
VCGTQIKLETWSMLVWWPAIRGAGDVKQVSLSYKHPDGIHAHMPNCWPQAGGIIKRKWYRTRNKLASMMHCIQHAGGAQRALIPTKVLLRLLQYDEVQLFYDDRLVKY